MGLRLDAVGGGGQFKQAIQQILESESAPLRNLEARKAKEDSKLKLFGEYKAKFAALDKALQELATFRKFRELKVDLGDGGSLVDVTLNQELAEPGEYEIEIDNQAAMQKGVTIGNAMNTLSIFVGSTYELGFIKYQRFFKVFVQAAPEFRKLPTDISL